MLTLLLLLQVPSEYLEAERAARLALERLGVSTRDVRVDYGTGLPRDVNGQQKGDRIAINTRRYPESVKSVYHEFWHYYQQQKLGGEARFADAYARHPYETNPFELEARLAADVMEHTQRTRSSLLFRLRGRTFESDIVDAMERARPRMRDLWKGEPTPHLTKFEAARSIAASAAKREAAGLAQFAAAYLLKEAMNGRIAVGDLAEPVFWRDTAVFTVAARVTEKALTRAPGLARAALPLAAGMAAVNVLSGRASLTDVLIDTGSFLAVGMAVNLVADGLIYPILFAAGPPGWIAAGVYTVAKLAITLYAGEKLSAWVKGLFGGDGSRNPGSRREGVRQKIDGIE